MVLAGLDGLRVLRQIRRTGDQIRRQFLSRNHALNEIRSALYLSGTYVRDYLLEPDPERAEAYRVSLEEVRREMESESQLEFEQTKDYSDLRMEISCYWEVLGPILQWNTTERRRKSQGPGDLKRRTLLELLLAATLAAGGYYLITYVPKHLRAGEPVLALGGYFLTYTPIQGSNQVAYVVPDSLEVWDTPAVIRTRNATLKSGEQVRALGHFRHWTHVRMLDGHYGCVNENGLMSAETHEKEERLLNALSDVPVQATGHSATWKTFISNLHAQPRW
jgi:hypothetical protein